MIHQHVFFLIFEEAEKEKKIPAAINKVVIINIKTCKISKFVE